MSDESEKGPHFGTVKTFAPWVVAIVAFFGGYKVLEYRVSSLELDVTAVKASTTSDHEFLNKVAEDLRLFMCSQNKDFCKR